MSPTNADSEDMMERSKDDDEKLRKQTCESSQRSTLLGSTSVNALMDELREILKSEKVKKQKLSGVFIRRRKGHVTR